MSEVTLKGNTLHVSAAASLQELRDAVGLQPALYAALAQHADAPVQPLLAQLLVASGDSLLATALLALDAELELQNGAAQSYGNWLALRATAGEPAAVAGLRFSTAARLDCTIGQGAWLAVARWPAGRTRVAIGGWGSAPLLAMDGREASGILEAAENTLMLASNGEVDDGARLAVVRELAQHASG